jgi:MFS transporter, putative metabolite:H+ symporter
VPESPRWLARHGDLTKADQIMTDIETTVERESGRPLPPVTKTVDSQSSSGHWTRLFEGIYLRRTITVWIMWFCAATIGYGLLVWPADHFPHRLQAAFAGGADL